MEKYKQALIAKIEALSKSNSPFARARVKVLLKLLGEIQQQEE